MGGANLIIVLTQLQENRVTYFSTAPPVRCNTTLSGTKVWLITTFHALHIRVVSCRSLFTGRLTSNSPQTFLPVLSHTVSELWRQPSLRDRRVGRHRDVQHMTSGDVNWCGVMLVVELSSASSERMSASLKDTSSTTTEIRDTNASSQASRRIVAAMAFRQWLICNGTRPFFKGCGFLICKLYHWLYCDKGQC